MDSAVDGLHYKTATQSGVTSNSGEFSFQDGEKIEFYLGENLLGESTASSVLTPIDFITAEKHPDTLINILRLLQSLDDDNNPENGIYISPEVQGFANETDIDFSVSQNVFSNNQNVLELLAKSGKSTGLIEPGRAALHFQITLAQENIQTQVVSEIYRVGGLISGLNGQLKLTNYGLDEIVVLNTDVFELNTQLPDNAFYNIEISQQPIDQTCHLINNKGQIKSTDVSSISVICQSVQQNMSGSVSGLNGSLILASDSNRYFISNNGRFAVATDELNQGVSIERQPENQQCSIEYKMVQENVQYNIVCINESVQLGGSITNLFSDITLKNSDGTLLYISNNGSFVFPAYYSLEKTYSIEIVKQPLGQICNITNGAGSYSTNSTDTVGINCENKLYDVNVNVEGLGSEQMPVYINGNLLVGEYKYAVAYNSTYNVTFDAPVTKSCDFVGGFTQNSMPASNVNLTINCSDVRFQYKISTSNFLGSLELSNLNTLPIIIDNNVIYVDTQYDTMFDFNISSQPTGQICSVLTQPGSVSTYFTDISVSCESEKHIASVTFTGLKAPLTIQNTTTGEEYTGQDNQFAFSVAYGQLYDIQVINHPFEQSCDVINSKGTVGLIDIDNIAVECFGTPYVIEVLVKGLKSSISLTNNGTSPVSTSLEKIRFAPSLNESFSISIAGNQPMGQFCSFDKSTPTVGTVTSTDVISIVLDCVNNQSDVVVTVANLLGESFDINSNIGPYVIKDLGQNNYEYKFSSTYFTNYSLGLTQPNGQVCSFDKGSLSSDVLKQDLVKLSITCENKIIPIFVNITGLKGSLLIENMDFIGDGNTFSTVSNITGFVNARAFEQVTLEATAPIGQTCDFQSSGKSTYSLLEMPVVGLPTINLECKDIRYNVAVKVENLLDIDLTIKNLSQIQTPVFTGLDATYTVSFKSTQLDGYDLSVVSQPTTQNCNFSDSDISTGKLSNNTISSDINITILCKNKVVSLPFEVTNLKGKVSLINNETGVNFSISSIVNANSAVTTFDYSTTYYTDHLFSVINNGSPIGQTCTVSNATVESITKNVLNKIAIVCVDDFYAVSGTIHGLGSTADISFKRNLDQISPTLFASGDTINYEFNLFANLNDVIDLSVENTSQLCEFTNNDKLISLNYSTPGAINTVDIICFNYAKLPIKISMSDPLLGLPEFSSISINVDIYSHKQISALEADRITAGLNTLREAIDLGNEAPVTEPLTFYQSGQAEGSIDISEGQLYQVRFVNLSDGLNCTLSNEFGYMDTSGNMSPVEIVCSEESIVNIDYFANLLADTGMVFDDQLKACLIRESGGLKTVADITSLNCKQTDPNPALSNNVLILDGIELFTNLSSLNLDGYLIGSLEPLRQVPSLNIEGAITFINVSYVALTDSHVASQFPIDSKLLACIVGGYTNPELVTIDQVRTIECDNRAVNADSKKIDDLTGLNLFPNLVALNLAGNLISDILPIVKLNILDTALPSKLRQLVLADNIITKLSITYTNPDYILGLHQLRSLNILDLRNNLISSVEILSKQDDLGNYYLSGVTLLDLITPDQFGTPLTFTDMDMLAGFYNQAHVHDSSEGYSVANDILNPTGFIEFGDALKYFNKSDQNYTYDIPINGDSGMLFFDRMAIEFSIRAYDNTYDFSLVLVDSDGLDVTEIKLKSGYKYSIGDYEHELLVFNSSNIEDIDGFNDLIGKTIDVTGWKLRTTVTSFVTGSVTVDGFTDLKPHIDAASKLFH
ncbi:MAG: hypothetical protein IME94_02810 [Proteobacteria bacterium]|nr:hypothetical protein [Pseudomonadota bacterium]